jgi:hypothetical protein
MEVRHMAYTDISPRIVTRERRVFHCFYECNWLDCSPFGSEWMDTLLVAGPSWCPCCGRKAEPDSVQEDLEYGPEFEDDDEPELTNVDAEAV